MFELFTIGFLAGLALAIPVGPMAIMLVNTTVSKGLRHGVIGALGMASVDGLYALTIFVIGAMVASILSSLKLVLGLIGATILLVLGIQTLVKNLALLKQDEATATSPTNQSTVLKTFGVFVAATVVNPPTALYFLAIAPNVANMGYQLSFETVAVFTVAVFIGSLIWQEALVFVGLSIRSITTNRFRVWLGLIGGALIIALAISIGYRALWS